VRRIRQLAHADALTHHAGAGLRLPTMRVSENAPIITFSSTDMPSMSAAPEGAREAEMRHGLPRRKLEMSCPRTKP